MPVTDSVAGSFRQRCFCLLSRRRRQLSGCLALLCALGATWMWIYGTYLRPFNANSGNSYQVLVLIESGRPSLLQVEMDGKPVSRHFEPLPNLFTPRFGPRLSLDESFSGRREMTIRDPLIGVRWQGTVDFDAAAPYVLILVYPDTVVVQPQATQFEIA